MYICSLNHNIHTCFRTEIMAKTKSGEMLKERQRKGFWSPEEDEKLRRFILSHGHSCWTTVPIKAGLSF